MKFILQLLGFLLLGCGASALMGLFCWWLIFGGFRSIERSIEKRRWIKSIRCRCGDVYLADEEHRCLYGERSSYKP